MMMRTVKHLNLQRINDTELRVISDVELGVLPVVQEEEAVIRSYLQHCPWPHRLVSLFILQDLQPLARQIPADAGLLPGGAASLAHRPVLQIYDLQDLASCHVFVNQQAMVKAGYWEDVLAIRGLLAHEHAHPLSENETTRSSRHIHVELALESGGGRALTTAATARQPRFWGLLQELTTTLCLSAPREIFANDTTIAGGFAASLLHLNLRNVANLQLGLVGRTSLRKHLDQEVEQGAFTPLEADQFMLIGAMHTYLELAMEVASFYRSGLHLQARQLESLLEAGIFPLLEPELVQTYTELIKLYRTVRTDLNPAEMVTWCQAVAQILINCLAQKALALHASVHISGM